MRFLVLLSLIALAGPAISQEEVTGEDARNFISSWANGENKIYSYSISFPEECMVHVSSEIRQRAELQNVEGSQGFVLHHEANISDLFPPEVEGIRFDALAPALYLVGHGRVVKRSTPIPNGEVLGAFSDDFQAFIEDSRLGGTCSVTHCERMETHFPVFFSGDANRISNAFRSLVESCGGRDEKF